MSKLFRLWIGLIFLLGAGLANAGLYQQPGPVWGDQSGTAASPGFVGEVIKANSNTSGTAIVTSTTTNLTSINLTPGVWLVGGSCNFTTSAQSAGAYACGLSTTSASFTAGNGLLSWLNQSGNTMGNYTQAVPLQILNLTTNTTLYDVGSVNFTSGTATYIGYVWAVRIK